jgi:hypothetical protein
LKTFRFQIFTDSERPNVRFWNTQRFNSLFQLISEEVQFEFFYGEGMKNVTTM